VDGLKLEWDALSALKVVDEQSGVKVAHAAEWARGCIIVLNCSFMNVTDVLLHYLDKRHHLPQEYQFRNRSIGLILHFILDMSHRPLPPRHHLHSSLLHRHTLGSHWRC
jgi:hypothetical protein